MGLRSHGRSLLRGWSSAQQCAPPPNESRGQWSFPGKFPVANVLLGNWLPFTHDLRIDGRLNTIQSCTFGAGPSLAEYLRFSEPTSLCSRQDVADTAY